MSASRKQETKHVCFQKFSWINPQGERVWNSPKNKKTKVWIFIDWIIVKETFTNLGAYLRVL